MHCQANCSYKLNFNYGDEMMSTKKFHLFCLNAWFHRPSSTLLRISEFSKAASVFELRDFSSKTSNDDNNKSRNKNKTNKYVDTKNDFVTHQLNTSFAAHLKRQQKLWNSVQKEERDEEDKRKLLKQSKIKRMPFQCVDNDGHQTAYKNELWKEKRAISDESSLNHKVNSDVSIGSDSDDYSIEKLETPNWDVIKLNKINKDVYRPSLESQNRLELEVDAFRTKMHIKIDSNALKPIFKFNELKELTEIMITDLERQHFIECTPVQAQGIPLALFGVNMLTISQSG